MVPEILRQNTAPLPKISCGPASNVKLGQKLRDH